MSTQFSLQKVRLALSLLAITYTLLGWYLAVHHVFWLMSIFILFTTLFIGWKSNPILEFLSWLTKQQIFLVIGVSLLISLTVALVLVKPTLASLIPLPLVTLIYALLEMRLAAFKQSSISLWLLFIAVLGLGLGEIIDLFITPSMRY